MSEPRRERPTALITGGSKGIGLSLAWEFARHGHDLVLVARDEKALARASAEIESGIGVKVRTKAVDLSRIDAPEELFRWTENAGIQVDVLVNNAGIGDLGTFAESSPDRQMSMVRLNVLSLTSLTHLFLKPMLTRGKGRILNVASIVAYFAGGSNWATYVASKAYVLSFTRGLAAELRGTGVTATALSPGTTETGFVSDARVGITRAYRWLPKVSTKRVAKVAYRAAMNGRTTVVPGLINKALAFLGELHPRTVAQGVFSFLSRTASTNHVPRVNNPERVTMTQASQRQEQ